MTRIDFYILPQTAERERALFACRLAEKAWLQDYRIYIHTGSAAAARESTGSLRRQITQRTQRRREIDF